MANKTKKGGLGEFHNSSSWLWGCGDGAVSFDSCAWIKSSRVTWIWNSDSCLLMFSTSVGDGGVVMLAVERVQMLRYSHSRKYE